MRFGFTAAKALGYRALNSDLTLVGDAVDAMVAAAPRPEDTDFADALRMSLTEALNNSIEHGYGGIAGNPIHIGLWQASGKLVIGIADRGRPLPEKVLRISREPQGFEDFDTLPEGGWGWMLILNGVDEVHYERVGAWNWLFLEKAL